MRHTSSVRRGCKKITRNPFLDPAKNKHSGGTESCFFFSRNFVSQSSAPCVFERFNLPIEMVPELGNDWTAVRIVHLLLCTWLLNWSHFNRRFFYYLKSDNMSMYLSIYLFNCNILPEKKLEFSVSISFVSSYHTRIC